MAYLSHVITGSDDYFWAWEAVEELVSSDRESAWTVLLQAVARCPTGLLHIVGAGPLEEFVVRWHDVFADRILEQLRADERFRSAFRAMYLFDISPELATAFTEVLTSHTAD